MSRSNGICEFCNRRATVAIFATGYPTAQAVTCDEHVENWKMQDATAPGSTLSWDAHPIALGLHR